MRKIFTLILFVTVAIAKPATVFSQTANVNDSLSLVALYTSTGGPHWTNNSNWLTLQPVSTWYGIVLSNNTNGQVIQIDLNANNLTGLIPPEIGNLADLRDLELQSNNLMGSIPGSLGRLPNLVFLYLGGNQLVNNIPDSLGTLAKLSLLDLDNNLLSGPIPSSLGSLSALTYLDLSHNPLNGGIPQAFSQLANLDFLNLASDSLNGAIPATLGNLGKLQNLYLDGNQFSDTIPNQLGNLANLRWLDLSANQLNGSIPANFGNLNNLNYLNLSQNQLTGNIPPALGNLSKLQLLYVEKNQLSGTIPSEIGNLTNLVYLWVSNNQLSGNIPSSLGNLVSMQTAELNYNKLTGGIPSALINLTNLRRLDLSFNLLNGYIPNSLGSLPSLAYLFLNNNYLTFNQLEEVAQYPATTYSPQDTVLPLQISNKLAVSAGGTLTNNTYNWYKGDTLVATISGDSKYKPAAPGRYSAAVTNSIATQLTLYSDTVAITNGVLPVTLINFTGEAAHNGNLLQWQTTTEINSAYFNIQRSVDGVSFSNIGKVAAAGNSNTIKNYSYTDGLAGLNPVPSILYYRLQQADKDGAVTYSKIIMLKADDILSPALKLYPNPVHGLMILELKTVTGPVDITLTDAAGKIVQLQHATAVAGQALTVDTQPLAAGVYFIQVFYNNQNFMQKFVRE
jgi:Leucine-rich repeat (LRR) protein